MADQKAMTVADVRAMLRGEPVEAEPVETPKPVEPAPAAVEANTTSPIVLPPPADDQLQYTVGTSLPPVAQKETGKRKKD